MTPRCGKPMLAYEAANGPMLDPPSCARPEDHAGQCRTAAALARKYRADSARTAEVRRVLGSRYGRPGLALAARTEASVTPAAWAAPALSLLLVVAAGFAAGYLAVGPAFFRPPPVPAPPRVLPSAVPSHGHPASPSPRRHRHHRASLSPVPASRCPGPLRRPYRRPVPSRSPSPSGRSWPTTPAPVSSSPSPTPSPSTIVPSSPVPEVSGWPTGGSEAP